MSASCNEFCPTKVLIKLDPQCNEYNTGKITLYPANIYLFKVNNRNTRKRYEMSSKLTIKTPERRQ